MVRKFLARVSSDFELPLSRSLVDDLGTEELVVIKNEGGKEWKLRIEDGKVKAGCFRAFCVDNQIGPADVLRFFPVKDEPWTFGFELYDWDGYAKYPQPNIFVEATRRRCPVNQLVFNLSDNANVTVTINSSSVPGVHQTSAAAEYPKSTAPDLACIVVSSSTDRYRQQQQGVEQSGEGEVEDSLEAARAKAATLKHPTFVFQFSKAREKKMWIPEGWSRKLKLPNTNESYTACDEEGNRWKLEWNGVSKIFVAGGWRLLVAKNKLRKGDSCIFEFMGGHEIKVHCFRASGHLCR